MELLREGQITYDVMRRRWLTAWPEDVEELETYGTAARAAEGQVC